MSMESDLKQEIVSEVRNLGKDKHKVMAALNTLGMELVGVNNVLVRLHADKLAGRPIELGEMTTAVHAANESWRAASNAIHGGHSPEGQE